MLSHNIPIEQGITQRLINRQNSNNEPVYNGKGGERQHRARSVAANLGLAADLGLSMASNILRMLPITKQLLGPPVESEAFINSLIAQQKVASSYEEWEQLSLKLDAVLGNEQWKNNPVSDLYDYELIALRVRQLRTARESKNYKKLLYLIRTTWNRNIGNIGNPNLYRHSLVGTKALVEEYLHECELAVKCLLDDATDTGLDDRYILGMLLQTRKAIGRTALVLSGGGCFGLFHIGVLSTLLEQDLLPRIVSGSSAGAIVASILSVHQPAEIDALLSDVMSREFIIFTAPEAEEEDCAEQSKKSVFINLLRFLKTGNWFDNAYLITTMKRFLGDLTFREAYNRTGRILNVTVSPASFHEQPRLLNYITSPNVLIWSAVCASCALPAVFPSCIIYEKDTATGKIREWNHISVKFVDGSVDNDLPITRLSEMFNVDHIIACQVNPHVTPFLKLSLRCVGGEIEHELSAKIKSLFNNIYSYATSEVIHYLDIIQEVGVARNLSKKIKSVLTQRYSGDITILPDLRISELGNVLKNPTPGFILDAAVRGARSTWPKIGLIHNHCFVEFLLDKTISYLRSRLICKKVNMNNVPLALVNSPIDSDNGNSEEELSIKETLFGDRRSSPVKASRRQRSESLTAAFGTTRSASHGNIKGLKGNKVRHQSSISGLRSKQSRESISASSALQPDDTLNATNTMLKYYSANSMPSSFTAAATGRRGSDHGVQDENFVAGRVFQSSKPTPTIVSNSKNVFDQSFHKTKHIDNKNHINFNESLVNPSSTDCSIDGYYLDSDQESGRTTGYYNSPKKFVSSKQNFKLHPTNDNPAYDRTS